MDRKPYIKPYIRPGYLSQVIRADERRMEFDCRNQIVVQKECPVDIVFIGDSIIQMWELSAYFQQFPLRILNRGIGGDRTASLLHRFRADAVQLKPKMVVMMAGINDAWDLEFDNWKQEQGRDLEEILEEALSNMEGILQIASKEAFQTVLCSILPTCMDWTNHEQERKRYVQLYNRGLKSLAETYEAHFVDFYPAFTEKDGCSLKREWSLEGLHPNVFGYDKMAEILKQEVDFGRSGTIKDSLYT